MSVVGIELDVSSIRPDQKVITEIEATAAELCEFGGEEDFAQDGMVKLGRLYHKLDQRYQYDEIRLAMIFIKKSALRKPLTPENLS